VHKLYLLKLCRVSAPVRTFFHGLLTTVPPLAALNKGGGERAGTPDWMVTFNRRLKEMEREVFIEANVPGEQEADASGSDRQSATPASLFSQPGESSVAKTKERGSPLLGGSEGEQAALKRSGGASGGSPERVRGVARDNAASVTRRQNSVGIRRHLDSKNQMLADSAKLVGATKVRHPRADKVDPKVIAEYLSLSRASDGLPPLSKSAADLLKNAGVRGLC